MMDLMRQRSVRIVVLGQKDRIRQFRRYLIQYLLNSGTVLALNGAVHI